MSITLFRKARHSRPPTTDPVPARRRVTAALAAVALVGVGAAAAIAEVTTPNPTNLKAFGPLSGEHGYPSFYEDHTGLRLEQCLDIEDPYCDPAFLRGEMPNGDLPVSFPDNWPLESFYYLAGSELEMPAGDNGRTGKAVLTAGLEATMANEGVQDGDQVVFGRLRLDIDFPTAGTFVVTHPYGVDEFTVNAGGDFRYVEDVTAAPGNFGLALRSRISPFLIRTGGLIELDNGNKYVGNPLETTTVTGSPVGTNFFQIDQRVTAADGTESLVTIATSDQFTLLGKVSTNSGINPQAATLVELPDGTRYLDVFATTDSGESVSIQGDGLVKTILDADGGTYFGRLPLGATVPSSVTFRNDTDRPVASRTMSVTDGVTITSATYDTATDELTVTATSTDQLAPAPVLTLAGVGELAGGTLTVTTTAPPAAVTVTSSGGGSDSAPVTVSGGPAAVPAETIAAISGPTEIVLEPGEVQTVTLSSASLNASSLLWEQTTGTDVGITGQTGQSVTFTAPTEPEDLTFQLTATGSAGSHTASFVVRIVTEATPPPPPAAPVAVATSSLPSAYLNQLVTISGSGSLNTTSYSWTQVSGPAVTITDPSAASFQFQMPAQAVTFELTAGGGEGTTPSTAQVTVTPVTDVLTVGEAQFRPSKNEWRVSGTASVTVVNSVKVYLRNTNGSKGALVGEGPVSTPVTPGTAGDWDVRVKGGINPGNLTQLIVESTRGGRLDGVTFTRKN